MKKISLLALHMRNFKGLENLEVIFDGHDLDIYGENESGKSTIVTGFIWLLTGKDEFNRQDYGIKNTVKKELNSQAHEVEAVFDVTGKGPVRLKRVYLEVWTKPKGQSTKVFSGHTTTFYFNDVPCNATEYQAKIDEIIPADLIRLLSNPTHFTGLAWQQQRAELLKVAGDITNDQVINELTKGTQERKTDFTTLNFVLSTGKTLDDYKKELGAKKALLKKAALEFSPRIAEVKRSLQTIPAADWEHLQRQIDDINILIGDIDTQLEDASKAAAAANKAIVDKQLFMYKRQGVYNDLKNKTLVDLQAKQNAKNGELYKLHHDIKTETTTLNQKRQQQQGQQKNIEAYKLTIETLNNRIEGYRGEWRKINAETFIFDDAKCQCPTCGQQLQPETIAEKMETLKANFLKDQTSRKNYLVERSNQVKAEINQHQTTIDLINETDLTEDIKEHENQLEALQHKLKEVPAAITVMDIEASAEALLKVNEDALYLQDEIKALGVEITGMQAKASQPANEGLKATKLALYEQLKPLLNQLAQKETIEYSKKRITQLMEEEKANAQAIADVENLEYDIETFTRAKMDILEHRVNAMFTYVSFRLFETQVNGGIAETCTAEYKGVPFAILNTAAKMLCGVDIIYTLSKFYKIEMPIFVDNRESVTMLPNRTGQLISLFVSEKDKTLRFEKPTSKSRKTAAAKEAKLIIHEEPETFRVTLNSEQIKQQRDNTAY
jgi:hypothetical protein